MLAYGSLCVGTNRDDDEDLSTSSHKLSGSQEKRATRDSWTHKFNNSLYGEANYPLGMLLLYVLSDHPVITLFACLLGYKPTH